MQLTFHKVLPEHAYEFTACHIECWRAAYRGILPDEYLEKMPSEIDERTERFAKNLGELDEEQLIYYAAADGKMMGRLYLGKSRDEDKPDAGEIGAFYLLKEYWGKGLGRQMMRYALDKLTEMGYREIILWVLLENARARRFYEKASFAFDGSKKEITVGKPLVEIRYTMAL